MSALPVRARVLPGGQGLGYLPDLPDQRDRLFRAPPEVIPELPPLVDLRPQFGPVWEQGALGSCTAHTVGAAAAFALAKQGAPLAMPSRLFLYYSARAVIDTTGWDSGAMLRDACKVANKLGVAEEALWPYEVARFTEAPPPAAYADAERRQCLIYRRLPRSLVAAKSCLAAGFPFTLGFSLYEGFAGPALAATGQARMPRRGEALLGGHAALVVGYDDRLTPDPAAGPGALVVRNSWGAGWGDDGYFYLPYRFFTNKRLSSDFWTLRLFEQV